MRSMRRHPVLTLITGVVVGFMLVPAAYELWTADWRGASETVATTAAFLYVMWWGWAS